MTDDSARRQSAAPNNGQGDRLALLRLYDELADWQKQQLLQFAVALRRRHVTPQTPSSSQLAQETAYTHIAGAPGPADSARAAVMLSGADAPARLAALAAEWSAAGNSEHAAHFTAAAEEAKAMLASQREDGVNMDDHRLRRH